VYVNEAEQILQARQGSATAWASLVSQHQDMLFRLAYLLMGDADEAEDVVQEALIRAFYALNRFDPTRPLRPWLFQIVRNLARNRRRSVRRYLAAVGRWWQATAQRETTPTPTGPTGAMEEEEAQVLWQAVQQLATGDQEVIYLRYFLELSVADTAATLEVAEGTVKSRLSRALVRLRRVVEREFPGLQREGAV
jgi:RNA polymerase sigma-70 factor, ECF subfamily